MAACVWSLNKWVIAFLFVKNTPAGALLSGFNTMEANKSGIPSKEV